ncbi:MAG: coenzyme F420-0:L-glutamate ligase [Candidatus Hodarchaeales archaeon]
MMRIEFIGMKTKIITPTDQNIVNLILKTLDENNVSLVNKDILIIASKIISTIEGCQVKISDIKNIRKEAIEAAEVSNLSPEFVEIVFREADEVIGAVPGAVLALKNGVLQANAGVDQSNSGGEEFLITLPKNSIKTAELIRKEIELRLNIKIGVVISDSKTQPLRRGTSGIALGVSGFSPIIDDRGSSDLFNRPMKITTRAFADNLVCGSEILMGESHQRIPIVIARGYEEIPFLDVTDTIANNAKMKMDPLKCIYMGPFWKNRRHPNDN